MKWIYLAIVLTSVLSLVQARPELVLENDSRNLITIGSFGFLAGGKLTLELSHLSLSDRLAQGILAFYIHRSSTVDSAYQDLETADEGSEDDEANDGDVPTCVLDHEIIRNEVQDGTCTILTVPDNQTVWTYEHIVAADEEALWTIVFVNCKHGSDVTLTLKTTELNPGPNHLSAGDSPLPKVYGSVAAAYVVAACIWGWALTRPDTKIFWSHRLMLLLVILVGINKALQALKYHYMKIGVDAEGYTISVYIFAFIKGSLSILIIVLIASGWMFIKPFLSDKDKRVISVVIPLQIIANVANVMASETAIGSVNWSFWSKLLPLVDMLAFVVVLWPILLTRKHLSSTTEIAGKETANLSKYRLWSTFYIVTIIYLYLTRVVVLLLHALLPFRYVTWVGELFSEVVTLAFWTFIGYKFRPYANNPYTQVPEDDDGDDVEGILREDTLPLHAVVRRVEREAED